MEPWHLWLIAAIVLMIAEVLTSDFLLATFGLACLAGCAAAALGAGLAVQLTAFVIAAAVCLAVVRPAAKRWLYRSGEKLKTNIDGMIGQRGTVVDDAAGDTSPGRVKIGGEEWRAISATGAIVPTGAVVEVVALDGATVTIRPLTPHS